jgi:hypothetical protein
VITKGSGTKGATKSTSDPSSSISDKERRELKQSVDGVLDGAMKKMGLLFNMRNTSIQNLKGILSKQLTSDTAMRVLKDYEMLGDPETDNALDEVVVTLSDEEIEFFHSMIFNLVLVYDADSICKKAGDKLPSIRKGFELFQAWFREHYRETTILKRFKELIALYGDAIKSKTLFSSHTQELKSGASTTSSLSSSSSSVSDPVAPSAVPPTSADAVKASSSASTRLGPIPEFQMFGIYELASRAPKTIDSLYDYISSLRELEDKCKMVAKHVPEMVRVLVVWIKFAPLDLIRSEMKTKGPTELPEVLFSNLFKTLKDKSLHKEMMIVFNILKNESKIQVILKFFEEFTPIISTFMSQAPIMSNMFGTKS